MTLVRGVEAHARQLGYGAIYLNAADAVTCFYERADSGRCRPGLRDDLAHHSDLKSPTYSEMMSPTFPG